MWKWLIITHTKWQNGLKTPRGAEGCPKTDAWPSLRSCLHYDPQEELLWAGALETGQVWTWTSFQGQSSQEGSAPNKARGAGRLCRTFYTTVKTVDFILAETEVLEIVTEDQVQHSGWSIEDEQGGMALKGQLWPQLTSTKECFHILFRWSPKSFSSISQGFIHQNLLTILWTKIKRRNRYWSKRMTR